MMNSNYKEYKEIHLGAATIADAVKILQEYQRKGEKAFCDFNGHMLYSDNVSLDSAYLEIVGMTKVEFDKKQQELREKLRRESEEYKKQIPALTKQWIKKGHEVLNKEYWTKWDECVPIRLGDLYKGKELGDCLEIVRALNGGYSLSTAKEIIEKQNHSGASYALVRAMVKEFCKRGEELYQ